ncbi:MAG: imelysin family protein [Sneathiellales bacterium]|nr:imelysin family protein [Sneathiellales bacterium]
MTQRIVLLPAFFLIFFCFNAAQAEEKSRGIIEKFVTEFAAPAYHDFYRAAEQYSTDLNQLCDHGNRLLELDQAFETLVLKWSRIEAIRLGPIREENRLERLFFWPDTRSRVSKQTSALLHTGMEKEISFKARSIAVQGLPALEYLQYASPRQDLRQRDGQSCALAKAIAGNILEISKELQVSWSSYGAFSKTLLSASEQNDRYRNDGEVLQDILKSASEMTELLANAKVNGPLGKGFGKSRYKRAPFWRSGLTLRSFQENSRAVADLYRFSGFEALLDEENQGLGAALAFEFSQVEKTLLSLESMKMDLKNLLGGQETYEKLAYIRFPLLGANRILKEDYPRATGLSIGFNSLDGD